MPAGHKIAARAIRKGEPILKYNVVIGFAAADIAPGTFVHSHNMEFREFDRDYAYAQDYKPVEMIPEAERASFMGIQTVYELALLGARIEAVEMGTQPRYAAGETVPVTLPPPHCMAYAA